MVVFVLWEIVENVLFGHQSVWSPVILLDIFLAGIPSFMMGIFAILIYRAMVAKELAQKALRRRSDRLAALYTLVTQINQTRDLDKILTIVLDQILQLVGIEGGGIWLRESPGGPLVLKTHRGLDDSFFKAVRQTEVEEERLNERMAQTGEPVIVDDVSTDPRITDPVVKKKGLQSCAYVPLWTRSEVIGVLRLYSYRQRQFTSLDVSLLTAIASQVGVAIENARLYEAVHQQLTEITILQAITFLISSSLDLEQMLQSVIQALGEVFDYSSINILLLAEQELTLRAHIESGSNDPAPPNTKLCWQAVSTGIPVFISGGQEATGQGGIQELSIPLKMQDTVLGVLNVRAGSHKALDQTDVKLFEALANQVNLGIYNAQLYAQVKNLNEQLQAMVAERTRQLEDSQLEVAQKARQLEQLLAEVTHIQDEERSRIAFDMHDGLIQLIIGALYESQAAEQSLAIKPDLTLKKLQSTQNLLQQTKDEIHRIVHDLHPPVLDRMGLAPAIKRYLAGYRQLVGIPYHLNISGQLFRLDAKVETAIYRIVQEAMHNIGKHSRAGSAQVSLDFGLKNVKIVIQDDGRGFDVEAASALSKEHLGLAGMKRRAQHIGGQLKIQSVPGQGTRLMLAVPRPEVG